MRSAHDVTKAFESALAEYTGAKYVVTTTSCTQALLMALAWHYAQDGNQILVLPKHTYVGVPSAVLNAGHRVMFVESSWAWSYTIRAAGGNVRDCAWLLEKRMYEPGEMQCLSFHWTKPLGLGQGGAILLDDARAAEWLRKARFDGRTEGVHPADDEIQYPNWHAYMNPETAATGLMRLQAGALRTNHIASWRDYPDISTQKAFQ